MKKHIYIVFVMLSLMSKAITITSTASGGTWGSSSTWIGGIAPGNNDDAVIAGNVTVNGGGTVHNLTINVGITFTNNSNMLVYGTVTNHGTVTGTGHFHYFNTTITSTTGGGDWASATTWVGGVVPDTVDNVIINGTVTIASGDPTEQCSSLTINSGKNLLPSQQIIVWGTLTNNGTFQTTKSVTLRGTNITVLSGAGTYISTGGLIIAAEIGYDTIASNVSYSNSKGIAFSTTTYASSMMLVNLGTVSLTSTGTVSNLGSNTCKWINGKNATLKISMMPLKNSSDTLDAGDSGNVVDYQSSVTDTIKDPLNNKYYNLEVSCKTSILTNLTMNQLEVISGDTLNLHGNNITLTGNWEDYGGISNNTGTTTFSASGSQCVLRTSGTEDFKNITITRTSKLGSNCTVQASGTVYLQPGGSMDCTCP